jgi:putative lipoic acid-binding regulatory protein
MSEDKTDSSEDSEFDLWKFPCDFVFKAMAHANQNAEDQVISVINRFIPGDYTARLNPSKKGNYVAVSVPFIATSKEQLDEIYLAVNELDCVKVCL